MKDLSIPVPGFKDHDNAEIILKIGGKEIRYDFRVVSFPWEDIKTTSGITPIRSPAPWQESTG